MGLNRYFAAGLVSAASLFGGAEARGTSTGSPIEINWEELFPLTEPFQEDFSYKGVDTREENFLDNERDVDVYVINMGSPLVSAQRELIEQQDRKISSLQNYGIPGAALLGLVLGYTARRARFGIGVRKISD